MFFKLFKKECNTLQAEILPALVFSNSLNEKVLSFNFENILVTGLQVSLTEFMFVELTFIPTSPTILNFILPSNFCLIACVGSPKKTHLQKIDDYGFVQYQTQTPITIAKPLCINFLCCKFPYGDTFFAPNIDTLKLALLQNAFAAVVSCKQCGIGKHLLLKSRFYEVLSIVIQMEDGISQITEDTKIPVIGKHPLVPACVNEFTLSTEDLEKISNAKAIIGSSLQNPCSLIALAHKVGLNDFKLKKCFKEVYGTTVFGYLHNVRMDKACTLLQQKEKISEVAYAVGYKNAQHFTAAFKKRFGVVPSVFLKNKKELNNLKNK